MAFSKVFNTQLYLSERTRARLNNAVSCNRCIRVCSILFCFGSIPVVNVYFICLYTYIIVNCTIYTYTTPCNYIPYTYKIYILLCMCTSILYVGAVELLRYGGDEKRWWRALGAFGARAVPLFLNKYLRIENRDLLAHCDAMSDSRCNYWLNIWVLEGGRLPLPKCQK